MRRTLLIVSILTLMVQPAFAEIIRLRDGRTLEGTIVGQSSEWITLNVDGIHHTYKFSEIVATGLAARSYTMPASTISTTPVVEETVTPPAEEQASEAVEEPAGEEVTGVETTEVTETEAAVEEPVSATTEATDTETSDTATPE